MKRKRIVLALITAALVLSTLLLATPLTGTTATPMEGYGYGGAYFPPPPTPGILYGNIINSDPINVKDAVQTLGFAMNIHQYYLNRPWLMNKYTGGEQWQQQWMDAYADIRKLLMQLAKEAGRIP